MSSIFDGEETARTQEYRTDSPDPDTDTDPEHFTRDPDQFVGSLDLGALKSILLGFGLANGYFWIGFPLSLALDHLGIFHYTALDTAYLLYVTTALVFVGGVIVAEAARFVHNA